MMSKKRVNCRTIDSFFTVPAKKTIETKSDEKNRLNDSISPKSDEKALECDYEDESSGKKTCSIPLQLEDHPGQQLDDYGKEATASTSTSCSSTILAAGQRLNATNDIGMFNKESVLDDFTKRLLLEEHWQPSSNFQLPFSEHKVACNDGSAKTIKRYLSKSHIDNYHWLVYSPSRKGLYCKYCAIFAQQRTVGHNKGMALGKLVLEPLQNFKNLKGKESDLEKHEKHQYHKESVLQGKSFLRAYFCPAVDVKNQISSQRSQQVQENRRRLRPIIESIIFLGRQNIPLRGHRDDGSMNDDASPEVNQGNFRELLRYRIASGDKQLESHLKKASNATYISKTIQNEIIKCCGEEICDSIVLNIKEARFYSILFDETTDISGIEQLSLSIRYVFQGSLREYFIAFVDAYDLALKDLTSTNSEPTECIEAKLSGEALGKIVLKLINNLGLDLNNCVGIGTDSCSVMASDTVGAVHCIQETAKNACRSPCSNHALNNSISKSSNIPVVRNAVSTVKSVVAFFNASAKRQIVFKTISKGSKLTSLCETRWVQRHDALIKFRDLLLPVTEALTMITQWQDRNTSSTANSLLNSLCSSIIVLLSLIDLLKETLPLSRYLQSTTLDVSKAADCFNRTITILEKMRKSAETSFSQVYREATEISNSMGFQIQLPRIAARQTHRENYAAETVEEYFKRSLYIPLLDNVRQDLKDRLPHTTMKSFELRFFMPDVILEQKGGFKEKAKSLAKNYASLFDESEVTLESIIEGELKHWLEFWKIEKGKSSKTPQTVLEVLEKCDVDIFPNIRNLLLVLATLPVSNATSERTFSTLRRAKTWLRARMNEERLNELCLLHIHRDIHVDIEKVLERFSKKKDRRIDLIL